MSDHIVLPTHPRFKNLTGQQFGRLTVLSYLGMTRRGAEWLCRCSCQNTLKVLTVSLSSGNTTSCGCITRERLIEQNSTHGLTYTAEYTAWVEFGGRALTLIEWSEISGVKRKTLSDRLDAGWSVEKALTQPPRPRQGAKI